LKDAIGTALVGAGLGFILSRLGFSSWDEVHRMFTFQSYRLTLAFAAGVAALSLGWYVVRMLSNKPPAWSRRRIHPGTVAGGVLFGAGWALSGACPSIALVQLGEGKLWALYTLVGIFAGNWLYSLVHERYFRWSATSCVDD
jgi:uncharacterized membrane protein YedE/YeeE